MSVGVLGQLYGAVTEPFGDLVDRDALRCGPRGKGVAKHVGITGDPGEFLHGAEMGRQAPAAPLNLLARLRFDDVALGLAEGGEDFRECLLQWHRSRLAGLQLKLLNALFVVGFLGL